MDWYDPLQEKKGGASQVQVPDLELLLERDGYLRDHEREIRRRWHVFFIKPQLQLIRQCLLSQMLKACKILE